MTGYVPTARLARGDRFVVNWVCPVSSLAEGAVQVGVPRVLLVATKMVKSVGQLLMTGGLSSPFTGRNE